MEREERIIGKSVKVETNDPWPISSTLVWLVRQSRQEAFEPLLVAGQPSQELLLWTPHGFVWSSCTSSLVSVSRLMIHGSATCQRPRVSIIVLSAVGQVNHDRLETKQHSVLNSLS